MWLPLLQAKRPSLRPPLVRKRAVSESAAVFFYLIIPLL